MENKYHTFLPRFLGGLFDSAFLNMVLIYVVQKAFGLNQDLSLAFIVVVMSIYPGYSIIMHGLWGQTLGKMITKVKVIRADEQGPIGFRQAMLRDCVPLLNSFIWIVMMARVSFFNADPASALATGPLGRWVVFLLAIWALLEFVTMLFSKKRRALHDLIAGTVVIREPEEEHLATSGKEDKGDV